MRDDRRPPGTPPPHLVGWNAAVRQRIADAITGYETALTARDLARTPQAIARATFHLNRADAEHKAAHAEHEAMLAAWSAHDAEQENHR
jgi:hypothetical protein